MDRTLLNQLNVTQFRGLENIEVNLGKNISIICGKNGTAKSTILGLIAQIFSFETDYSVGPKDGLKQYRTITDKAFTSNFREHFRFSKKFDLPYTLRCTYSVDDALLNQKIDSLSLEMSNTADRDFRTTVRGNVITPISSNTSRNVTHPVIYLSLKRLIPLPMREKYIENSISYLQNNQREFIQLSNSILGKRSSNNLTATSGTLDSAVAHNDKYDHESVSVGEDNCGQIVLALMSFKKLSEEMKESYKGGILLIDEVDAGLFPAAQKNLVNVMRNYSEKYKIQIIMTTHSPLIIEDVKILSSYPKAKDKFKVIYLTNTYGKTEINEDIGWEQILADLKIETLVDITTKKLPAVNVYFEDKEASDFFASLVTKREYKFLNKFDDVTNGCEFYKSLMKKNIPEFCTKSLIVFDADVAELTKHKNALTLPGGYPPDQLVFDFLYRLPAGDNFWRNSIQYTREVFIKDSSEIFDRLSLSENPDSSYNLNDLLTLDIQNGNKRIRDLFKTFYKSNNIQRMLKKIETNPFRYYLKCNPEVGQDFNSKLNKALQFVLTNGYQIETSYVKVALGSA
ncbi:ATP-dependent nuclease [Acinetobacter sp. ULE_I037]|uniref:ATP-dependent nuclease n=1 Tax=unclassified Acinetobacter TaxID=196816 RepID=UPI003AF84A62